MAVESTDASISEAIEVASKMGEGEGVAGIEDVIGGIPQPPRKEKVTWVIGRDTITSVDHGGFVER